MKNKFTPLHIELILHYHCACNPPINQHTAAVCDFTMELEELGLIRHSADSGSGYRCTDKGNVFCEKLCNTVLPVQVWQ
jgi:hypothetical protein